MDFYEILKIYWKIKLLDLIMIKLDRIKSKCISQCKVYNFVKIMYSTVQVNNAGTSVEF